MFSSEKIVYRWNRFVQKLFSGLFFWYASFLFYMFLTGENQIFKQYFDLLQLDSVYWIALILALATALLLTILDALFIDRILRFLPRHFMAFLKSLMYLASIFVLLLLAARLPIDVYQTKDYKTILNTLPVKDIHFIRFLVYFYLVSLLHALIREMQHKMSPGNFRNWIFGLLNKPREEERIFMFIDMKSSTTIAEKLMHKKFSHLVQDVFNDLVVVYNYHAEIYQYLGDGAIISWNVKKGMKRNNFLKAYFAFVHIVKKRSRYYNRKYGMVPRFKAGMHAGKVMVLQVGQIRRDISYNGDTINTAARIESACNEFHADVLISGDLYNLIADKKEFSFKNVGHTKLKGKRRSVELFQVRQKK